MLSVAFFAAVGSICWVASDWKGPDEPEPSGMKKLSGTVAEGLVYRATKEAFPRATCDACRTGRIKAGIFSLGGFQTIEFDNLVVNLPAEDSENTKGKWFASQDAVADYFGLKPFIKLSGGDNGGKKKKKKMPKIAGITVNGLTVNKIEKDAIVPLVKAKTLKNSGRHIELHDVSIFRDGAVEDVASARLVMKPYLMLKWRKGSYRLPVKPPKLHR